MSNTLERRLSRLECGTADTPGMLIHWAIDEQAQPLECNGQRFTRRDGEGHEDFKACCLRMNAVIRMVDACPRRRTPM